LTEYLWLVLPVLLGHFVCYPAAMALLCLQCTLSVASFFFFCAQGSKAVPITLRVIKQASVSAHNFSCRGAELISLEAHLHTTPQQPRYSDSWEDDLCQGKNACSLAQLWIAKLVQCFFLTWYRSP